MKISHSYLPLVFSLFLIGGCSQFKGKTVMLKDEKKLSLNDFSWMSEIRPDHPRLFFNKDTFSAVKARALGDEKAYFEKMKKAVDDYPDDSILEVDESWLLKDKSGNYKIKLPKSFTHQIIKYIGGREAAQAAFVYLVTGDKKYLEKAKKMLKLSIKAYEWSWEHQLPIEWEINHYPSSLMAYDWLYNEMAPEERAGVIKPLMNIIAELQPGGKARFHRCFGGASDGFYGSCALLWYAGIVAYKNGICDKEAEKFLKEGYKLNIEMLNYRDKVSDGDGLLAAAVPGYSFGAYPLASYNFFHTFKALTGHDVSSQWEHMANYPQWVYWNWIPATEGGLEFGIGDCQHINNKLPLYSMYMHLSQNMHFYNTNVALSQKLISDLPDAQKCYSSYSFPITPFLLTNVGKPVNLEMNDLSKEHAKYFKSFGLAFMRSGIGSGDTYCMFRAGAEYGNHQHLDENSFIIYHKGFLALDSGTRAMTMSYHLPYYYAQTVAHNSILIHMPDEPMPMHWGPETIIGPYKEQTPYCHGGQSSYTDGKCLAFESNNSYTYVAGDATRSYNKGKCTQAIRQFVFIYPDLFVVFDRVSSTKPEYKKEWLLHTQNEPEINGNIFSASEGEGVIFCKTLYPTDAKIQKVGGSGKEFWASGKNWELHSMEKERCKDQKTLFGNWRIELSPALPAKDDYFLHFIQVGDKEKLVKMRDSKLINDGNTLGFIAGEGEETVEILFNKTGKVGGKIKIQKKGVEINNILP